MAFLDSVGVAAAAAAAAVVCLEVSVEVAEVVKVNKEGVVSWVSNKRNETRSKQ